MARFSFKLWMLLWALWGVSGCKSRSVQDDYVSPYRVPDLIHTLDSIASDSLALRVFFEAWNRLTPPNRPAYIAQNDTIQALYALFEAYFKEKSLDTLYGGTYNRQSRSYILSKTDRYVLVPPALPFVVCNIMEEEVYECGRGRDDTLFNFRPPLQEFALRRLYLSSELAAAFNTFLGRNDPDMQKMGVIINDGLVYRKYLRYEDRRRALSKVIALSHGHKISQVCIDQSLTIAHIHLYEMGGGCAAIFTRAPTSNVWRFKGKKLVWVE